MPRQKELPNTRRPDEIPLPPQIDELDTACEDLEKAEGKRARAGQGVVAAKKTVQELLVQHNIPYYEYDAPSGIRKKRFRKESLGGCKVKVNKKTDAATDDGDEE